MCLWTHETTDNTISHETFTFQGTSAPVFQFSSHSSWISACKWHNGSSFHLLSSSYDGKVMLWDLRTAVSYSPYFHCLVIYYMPKPKKEACFDKCFLYGSGLLLSWIHTRTRYASIICCLYSFDVVFKPTNRNPPLILWSCCILGIMC